jgi:DNA-binding transcriptional ArsR family regulator
MPGTTRKRRALQRIVGETPKLALTRAIISDLLEQLGRRDFALLRAIVAFDIFVGPQLLAVFLGLSPTAVGTSLSKLKRTGLVRDAPEGRIGLTYGVLRDIFPARWRRVSPIDALRMAALLVEDSDWYAISRRAELYVLGGLLEDAVREFERAAILAQDRGLLEESAATFMLAAKTSKAALNSEAHVQDKSFDEDWLVRAAERCQARAASAHRQTALDTADAP